MRRTSGPISLPGSESSIRSSRVEVESLIEQHDRPGHFLDDVAELPHALGDLSGRTLGAYRLTRLLGSGGMGAVYLAERSDGAFSKQVAVKVLSLSLAHARERFHRERELLARLEHPNIARLIDGGTTADGWPYLVMEYVEGLAIDRYCGDRDLPINDRLALLLQVCAGVAHAHQRLIVHCDIKPANILVTDEGVAKLLDFGIARLDLPEHATECRAATPAFSSPEQWNGGAITTASDVYAIGVLGYVLCTGGWPYPPATPLERLQVAVAADPIPASRVSGLHPARARQLRGDLEHILSKAVAKDPSRRYGSAQDLAHDLESLRRGFPVRASADSVGYRVRKFAGRHRVACIAAIVMLLSLIAAVLFSRAQAEVAARRFDDLREFARVIVFDADDMMRPVPGTTAARKLVVDTALRYLDRLSQERVADPTLREELVAAYIRVGKVQGGAFLPNLGDTVGAISSFGKAVEAVGGAPASPSLERLRIEAHINIALLATDPIRGAPEFDHAIEAAERQLAVTPDDVATLRLLAQAYHGQATIAHVINHVPDHERTVARAVEIRERVAALNAGNWQDQADLAREYAQVALALLQKEDPDGRPRQPPSGTRRDRRGPRARAVQPGAASRRRRKPFAHGGGLRHPRAVSRGRERDRGGDPLARAARRLGCRQLAVQGRPRLRVDAHGRCASRPGTSRRSAVLASEGTRRTPGARPHRQRLHVRAVGAVPQSECGRRVASGDVAGQPRGSGPPLR